MTTPTIEIGTAEQMAERSPVQRLIAMVLLLAIKDCASQVRFQSLKGSCRLNYVVKGIWLDLVPPPNHLMPRVIRAIQATAGLDLPLSRIETSNQIQLRIGRHSICIMIEILTNEDGQQAVIQIPDPGELSSEAQTVLNTFLNTWRERPGPQS